MVHSYTFSAPWEVFYDCSGLIEHIIYNIEMFIAGSEDVFEIDSVTFSFVTDVRKLSKSTNTNTLGEFLAFLSLVNYKC